jgi:hypothetical protein
MLIPTAQEGKICTITLLTVIKRTHLIEAWS